MIYESFDEAKKDKVHEWVSWRSPRLSDSHETFTVSVQRRQGKRICGIGAYKFKCREQYGERWIIRQLVERLNSDSPDSAIAALRDLFQSSVYPHELRKSPYDLTNAKALERLKDLLKQD